jgi:hypothetical protein
MKRLDSLHEGTQCSVQDRGKDLSLLLLMQVHQEKLERPGDLASLAGVALLEGDVGIASADHRPEPRA